MRLIWTKSLVDRSTIEHRPIISLSVVDDARLGTQTINDVVQVDLIENVPSGSMARTATARQSIREITNPQAVLETELRHYSALTGFRPFAFDYNSGTVRYSQVEEVRRGEKKQQHGKGADCDIATDFFYPPRILTEKETKRKSDDRTLSFRE
jgi:hypothetical protein